jgi:hypothetical protein
MSKEKTKATAVESAQAWIAKHADEGKDFKALSTAIAAVEKKTAEAQAAANKLGEVLEARKLAIKALKEGLKAAKAARKAPPAPAATPKPKAVAPKKAAPKKVAPAKATPAG